MTAPRDGRPALRWSSNVRRMAIGNAVYAAAQWGQLVIIGKFGGPSALGLYAFALALTAPIMNLAGLQVRMLQASDTRRAYAFEEYRRLRLATTVAAMAAVAVIAPLTERAAVTWAVLVPICLLRAADAISDVYYGLWQQSERMGPIGTGMSVNSVCSVLFVAAGWLLGGGIVGAAFGSAAGSGCALVYILLRTASDHELRPALHRAVVVEWKRVARLALEALPLGLIVLLDSLQQNVPRYFIKFQGGGDRALGLFAATIQLTAAGAIVVAALGAAATPRLAALCARGDLRQFRLFTAKVVAAAALLGCSGVVLSLLAGKQVLTLVYRPEFAAGASILVILSVSATMGWIASLLGYALTAARVIAVQPAVLIVTLVTVGALCAILVPSHGAAGAAWSLLLANSLHAVANAGALLRFRRSAALTTPSIPVTQST